jgi:hypothetical protein
MHLTGAASRDLQVACVVWSIGPGEVLVHVMVGVYQTRRDQAARCVQVLSTSLLDELAGAGTTGGYRWIPVNSSATRS